MSEHATLAPSAASRWVKCPGSVRLAALYPEHEDTDAAAEGTAAHWVVEQAFANGGKLVPVGTIAPNGVEVTEEMLEGAEMYIDVVGLDHGGHIERRVTMAKSVHPDNWGTPDFFGLRNGILRIIDYKFGHGYVEEFENWQCLNYAAGICEFLDIRPELGTGIEITIVQPRYFGRQGPVRTWSTDIVAIQPYIAQLRQAAAMAVLDESPCIVGDYCKHCPGRHACEALQDSAMDVAAAAYSNLPLELTPQQAGRELTALTAAAVRLESRITGLQHQLLFALRGGAAVPNWGVEQAQGRQKWLRAVPEVLALGQIMGVDLSKPSVVTPKQAIAKGIPEAMVSPLSETPLGEWKLVRVDTKQARKAFAK